MQTNKFFFAVLLKFSMLLLMQFWTSFFQDWEILILGKLKWDLSAVTPYDFLEQIFCRLPFPQRHCSVLRKHAATFIALCCTGMCSYLQQFILLKKQSMLIIFGRLITLLNSNVRIFLDVNEKQCDTFQFVLINVLISFSFNVIFMQTNIFAWSRSFAKAMGC